jgi:hypothetical protein
VAVVADEQPLEVVQPGEGALHHPAGAAKPGAVLGPAAGDLGRDPAVAELAAVLVVVVAAVGLDLEDGRLVLLDWRLCLVCAHWQERRLTARGPWPLVAGIAQGGVGRAVRWLGIVCCWWRCLWGLSLASCICLEVARALSLLSPSAM